MSYEQLLHRIESVNKILEDEQPELSNHQLEQYFRDFRHMTLLIFEQVKYAQADDKAALLYKIRDPNSLYSIRIKMGIDLPNDLQEIAEDFDSETYPREDYLIDKIESDGYLLQQKAESLE